MAAFEPAVRFAVLCNLHDNLAQEIKTIEAWQTTVQNQRQTAETAFQASDQRASQMYEIMASILKTLNDERSTVNNYLH